MYHRDLREKTTQEYHYLQGKIERLKEKEQLALQRYYIALADYKKAGRNNRPAGFQLELISSYRNYFIDFEDASLARRQAESDMALTARDLIMILD